MKEQEEFELLNLLKERLIKAAKQRNLDLSDSDFGWNKKKDSKKKEFYLKDRNNNLFEKPRKDVKLGFGNDAVRSSAAMIFNLLGQEDIIINSILYNSPEYETKLEAIRDINGRKHFANLDATLTAKDNSIFLAIESKMLEWIGEAKKLSQAYLCPDLYINKDKSKKFIDFFNKIIKNDAQHYDAIQMTIHILALYNACVDEKKNMPDNIKLLNIVWEYDCDDYRKEKKESEVFIETANKTFRPLFKELNHDFLVEYKTAQKFINEVDFSLNPERKNYLDTRYFI